MKKYNTMYGVGKSRHMVNFHDGIKKHSDGSPFYDMRLFKNKKDLNAFLWKLSSEGYREAKQEIYN